MYHTIHTENSAKGRSAILLRENILHYKEAKYDKGEIRAADVCIITKRFLVVLVGKYCSCK